MKPTESQFPISHVNKLHNIGEEHFKHEGDNEGDLMGNGRYLVADRGYNDKHEASATFEIPGSKNQNNWGTTPARTYGFSDPKHMQDTFDNPNAARQAAVNDASSKHVKAIKEGDFVTEKQSIKKGGVVKINSNPAKGK